MATLQLTRRTRKVSRPVARLAPVTCDESVPPAVSAGQVRGLLVELAIALHATRVVRDELEDGEDD